MITDQALIARILSSDDQHAFATLINRYQSGIRQFLRRLTGGDHHMADDLAQETFLSLYKSLSNFRGDSALNTWLHKIGYHHFLKSQQRAYQRHEQLEHDFSAVESSSSDLDQDLMIERMMAQLSVPQRTCITLAISAGMSHPEIVAVTDYPLGTVKSHINRAKHLLSQLAGVSHE